jgi:uncharacterized protein (DUF433 family)
MSRGRSKTAISFRFAESTVSDLRRRARRAGRTRQTELAERYLVEGMRQDDHPLIHFREGPGGRRPTLLGSRLDVADIIRTIRQNENSPEAAAAYLEIPPGHVQAAVAYYADYKDEVDAEIADREDIAEEQLARWQRQREALA